MNKLYPRRWAIHRSDLCKKGVEALAIICALIGSPAIGHASDVFCRQTHEKKDGAWTANNERKLRYTEQGQSVLVGSGANKQTFKSYSEDNEARYFINEDTKVMYRMKKAQDIQGGIKTWEALSAPAALGLKGTWLRAYTCTAH